MGRRRSGARCALFLFRKQRLKPRTGVCGTRACDGPSDPEGEEIAEVSDRLVDLPLGLRLAALVVCGGGEEAAIQAAVEVGTAAQARIAPPDALHRPDVVTALLTEALHLGSHQSRIAYRRPLLIS
jgi:hypothetical protein